MNILQINTLEQVPAGLTLLFAEVAELKHLVSNFHPQQPTATLPPEYRTRKETAAILKITLATLNEYTKSGKIVGSRIGNRVLYNDSDIKAALKSIKTQNLNSII